VSEDEVVERVRALPDHYAGRVRPDDLDGMRDMASGGEWQELVALLVGSLNLTNAAVTAQERDELQALLTAVGMPNVSLARLNITEPDA